MTKFISVVYAYIKNVSANQVSYNRYQFKLKDGRGSIQGPVIVFGFENELHSGDLAPGGSVEGWLSFQITKGDRNLTLIYSPPCIFFCDPDKEIRLQETYRR